MVFFPSSYSWSFKTDLWSLTIDFASFLWCPYIFNYCFYFLFLRYWKAGPGPWGWTGFQSYKYLNFGYVFLQDLIERSFIDIMSGGPVTEPGIFVQQFPYPCYIRDVYVLSHLFCC